MAADSKNVVTRLKMEAANYKTELGHDVPIDYLSSRLADYNQINTQKAMQRVFGVETIIAGIDVEKGPSMFKVDPAGYYFGYKGVSSGVKEQDSINYLEKEMKKKGWDLSEEDAVKLAITTLQSVIGQEFKSNDIEIGLVSERNPKFTKLSVEQLEFYLNEVAKKD
jgi:20S proteasome subunit alpha 1